MIIDFHTHIFSPEVRRNRESYLAHDSWFGELYALPKAICASELDLVNAMNDAGVDRAVLCGFGWNDIALCRDQNDFAIDCQRRYPDKLLAFAALQPRAGDAAIYELERCVQAGVRGIGEVCPDGQGWSLDDESFAAPLAEAAIRLRLPLLVHTTEPVGHEYHGKGTVTLQSIYRLMSRHPQVLLICGHWGGGFPFYELMPEVATTAQNVVYDTAASLFLYRDDIFRIALSLVGQRKIIFGSDFPLIKPARFLTRIRKLGLPEDVLSDIIGNNAARLLGIVQSDTLDAQPTSQRFR